MPRWLCRPRLCINNPEIARPSLWYNVSRMPGNVALATPSGVLPQSLSKAFQQTREYPVLANVYRNGEFQRSLLGGDSRKRWVVSKRLTATQLSALETFFNSHKYSVPFYFYDPFETDPFGYWNADGALNQGRFIVTFDGQFSYELYAGRHNCDFSLIEVA
jgi:hypothetical protein